MLFELFWTMFLMGFGACFGYTLRDHMAIKEAQAFCDDLQSTLDARPMATYDVVVDHDYYPLPLDKRHEN